MMVIDASNSSPNHSPRDGAIISMIVMHATVGPYAASLAWLCNPQPDHPDDRVSIHYLIRKDGHTAQLVAESDAAWHAGKSAWRGLNSLQIMNQSIGIELENRNDGRDPYPRAQLDSAITLCKILIANYKIAQGMLVRHLDIAVPKGRKTDPAGLPWADFQDAVFAPPVARAYRVLGLPIYQRSDRTGPLAGHLAPGDRIVIDDPANGHIEDERGFVRTDPDTLEPL